MASGDISWSGKALRAVLWRAPLRATQYTAAGYVATTQEVGRRWLAMAGFGLWIWGLWWLAMVSSIQGFQEVAAFLLLLWFWRLIALGRWTVGLRVAAARTRAMQRQQLEILQRLEQGGRQAIAQIAGGTFTMLGSMRQHDPVRDEHDQMARDQAAQVRRMLDDPDAPLGDRFEPIFRLPRWLRRRGGDRDG